MRIGGKFKTRTELYSTAWSMLEGIVVQEIDAGRRREHRIQTHTGCVDGCIEKQSKNAKTSFVIWFGKTLGRRKRWRVQEPSTNLSNRRRLSPTRVTLVLGSSLQTMVVPYYSSGSKSRCRALPSLFLSFSDNLQSN